MILALTAKNWHTGLNVYLHDLHVNVHDFNNGQHPGLPKLYLTFSILKCNRILKCYLERNIWKHKLFWILLWVKINALEQCLLHAFQFLLLLTFSAYVGDENSQNFHDWYTGWNVPDSNINLIQGKNNTLLGVSGKGWKSALS